MKAPLYPLFFCFLPIVMFSQSKFEFGATMGPSLGFPLYVDNGNVPNIVTEAIKEVETWAPGASALLLVKMHLTEKLSACSGFGYTISGYGTKEDEFQFSMPDPIDPEKIKFTYRKTYLEVPFALQWRVGKNDTPDFFFISGGASLWLNLTNKTVQKATFAGGRVERSSMDDNQLNYRKSNVLVQLSGGFEQQISERMRFAIEPQIKMTLLPLIEDEVPLNRKLLTTGLAFSVFFK